MPDDPICGVAAIKPSPLARSWDTQVILRERGTRHGIKVIRVHCLCLFFKEHSPEVAESSAHSITLCMDLLWEARLREVPRRWMDEGPGSWAAARP